MLMIHILVGLLVGLPGWILSTSGECLKAAGDILQRECSEFMRAVDRGAKEAGVELADRSSK